MAESRKEFIKKIIAGSITASFFPQVMIGNRPAGHFRNVYGTGVNEETPIRIGLIGKGTMGTSDTDTALRIPGVKLVAVCDLYDARLQEAKTAWGNDLFTTKDYTEILSRQDIDAVIIATPDHWHQRISIEALNAGKHVYCEKPAIRKLNEAEDLIKAQRASGRLYQVGSQGMASLGNRKARQLVQSGIIGKVHLIEGFFTSAPQPLNEYPVPDDASEKTVWWNRFLGNAPKRPFDAQRFFYWRNWSDYGTGVAGDLFVHVLASLHFITDAAGPEKVYATGGIDYYSDGKRDMPDILLGYSDYPDRNNIGAFKVSLGVNYSDGISKKWGSLDFRIIGDAGTIEVKWDSVTLKTLKEIPENKFTVLDPLGQGVDRIIRPGAKEYVFQADDGYKGGHYDHFEKFFNGIRNNAPIDADVLFAVRSAAPALLCYESYLKDSPIFWDAEKLKIKKSAKK